MPSGDDYERKLAQKAQQKAAQDSSRAAFEFTNDFFLKDGQTAVVRFLEEGTDLTFADVHRLSLVSKSGKQYFKPFVCLDQYEDGTPCPACQSSDPNIKRKSTQGFVNLILRDGPVFQRDPETKRAVRDSTGNLVLVGTEDQIAIWRCSWTVFTMLKTKDAHYKGLMARDWIVSRIGSTKNDTQYMVEPADPTVLSQPMTIADMSLATQKYDLKGKITKPMDFAAMVQILGRGAVSGDGPQPTFDRSAYAPQGPPTAQNTFNDAPRAASAFTRG